MNIVTICAEVFDAVTVCTLRPHRFSQLGRRFLEYVIKSQRGWRISLSRCLFTVIWQQGIACAYLVIFEKVFL